MDFQEEINPVYKWNGRTMGDVLRERKQQIVANAATALDQADDDMLRAILLRVSDRTFAKIAGIINNAE